MKADYPRLNICFMGGKQAGILGSLTALSAGNRIMGAVSYSDDLKMVLKNLGVTLFKSIYDKGFVEMVKKSDVLLSVHGREVIPESLLKLPRLTVINVHPFLYKYKGASPVERALRDKETRGSVGVHIIEKEIDCGKVLIEEFIDISGAESVEQIYNRLYPIYCSVILKTLKKVPHEKK